jgi:hypothetical protein
MILVGSDLTKAKEKRELRRSPEIGFSNLRSWIRLGSPRRLRNLPAM